MGVFEHFPYVNFHELNFSWMIAKIQELEDIIAHNIVDVVARAGVAVNAQAISNLSTTVTNNATTAHNEALAASNAAAVADGKAVTAQNGVNTLNTLTTKHRYTSPVAGSVHANIDSIVRFDVVECTKMVIGSISFHTVGALTSGDILMEIPLTANFDGTYDCIVKDGSNTVMVACMDSTKQIKMNGTIPSGEYCYMMITAAVN